MSKKEKVSEKFLRWAVSRYDELNELGIPGYAKFSEILAELKEHFKDDEHFREVKDIEQSWKTILGRVLEELIEHAIRKELETIGLKCAKPIKEEMGEFYPLMVKQLGVPIGENELLPDADRIVFRLNPFKILAILSIKKKFRERIAQVAYWTIQLRKAGKNIKNIMVTTDENGTFTKKDTENISKKEREERVKAKVIAEEDINGTFVATEAEIEETGKVKRFETLVNYLRELKEKL